MKIAVIGIGNILQKDDGIGIRVIEDLKKEKIEEIEIIDGGTAIYDLLPVFMEFQYLVIVDSLKAGYEPGTIYRLSLDELKRREGKFSLHEVHFLDVLKMIRKLGHNPEVTVIGIEPKEITFSMELSEELEKKIPEIIKVIKLEIGHYISGRIHNA